MIDANNETLPTKALAKRKKIAGHSVQAVRSSDERPEPNDLEAKNIRLALRKLSKQGRGRHQTSYNSERHGLSSPHSDELGYHLTEAVAFGTTSGAFVRERVNDIASVVRGHRSKPTESEINAALAFVDGGEPQNEIEATLLVQMATTHSAAMQCLLTATGDMSMATDGGLGNLAVKLLRTYTSQVEALTKLRRGGEQIVRHIHVDNRGGQAVIGETVNTGGGVSAITDEQSFGPDYTPPMRPALLSQNTAGNGVPIPSDARKEAVPHSRRDKPRRAKGQ